LTNKEILFILFYNYLTEELFKDHSIAYIQGLSYLPLEMISKKPKEKE